MDIEIQEKIISLFLNNRNLLFKSKIKEEYFNQDILKDIFKLLQKREIHFCDNDLKNIVLKYFDNEKETENYIKNLFNFSFCEKIQLLEPILIESFKLRSLKEVKNIDFNKNSKEIEEKICKILKEVENTEENNCEFLNEILDEDKYFNQDSLEYLKTDLIDFDKNYNGIPKKALTIIAGLPSMGKTTIATQLALNISKQHNVLFFSEEQSKQETIYKIVANLAKINSRKIINKQYLNEEEKETIKEVIATLKDYHLKIDDRGNLDCFEMEKEINKYIRQNGKLDLVIVDHLQITKDIENEKQQYVKYGNITRDMKNLAKKYNIAFICLSQLSRATFENDNKVPELNNLKNSGDIEANADMVIFVHRPEYFLSRKLQSIDNEEDKIKLQKNIDDIKYLMKLLIKKNRNGILGEVNLYCDLEKQFINNLSK